MSTARLASLGVGLAAIYAMGFVRPDSMLAIVVFAVGIVGLFVIPR